MGTKGASEDGVGSDSHVARTETWNLSPGSIVVMVNVVR